MQNIFVWWTTGHEVGGCSRLISNKNAFPCMKSHRLQRLLPLPHFFCLIVCNMCDACENETKIMTNKGQMPVICAAFIEWETDRKPLVPWRWCAVHWTRFRKIIFRPCHPVSRLTLGSTLFKPIFVILFFFFRYSLKRGHVWPNALCSIVRENSNRKKKNVYVTDWIHVLHIDDCWFSVHA